MEIVCLVLWRNGKKLKFNCGVVLLLLMVNFPQP
ncbi:hypothetical protein pipiens_014345, partial [Culex pipiens pipiens]